MIDIIKSVHGTDKPRIEVLDKGFVELWDVMPRLVEEGDTADTAIAQAARNSYQKGTSSVNADRGLIRYLMRHRHTTPLEMVEFKFFCSLPIIAARQMIRHRTANVNEMSARYSVMPKDFYYPAPDQVRTQSQQNKQKTTDTLGQENADQFIDLLKETCDKAYDDYENALADGVCREQARMLLPVNIYTNWVWKIDLHNLLHFLALRCDSHAQYEIRVFANAMLELIKPICPATIEAWDDYHPMRGGMLLTRLEIEALQYTLTTLDGPSGSACTYGLRSDNKREQNEWKEKADKLGFLGISESNVPEIFNNGKEISN